MRPSPSLTILLLALAATVACKAGTNDPATPACTPTCAEGTCGSDGCGGTCECTNATCQAGRCVAGGALDLPRVPWEGGPTYYADFPVARAAGWTDPAFFPIGVWFESVLTQGDVDLDKAAGLNTYVELTENSDIDLVRRNGMFAIPSTPSMAGAATVGWLITDEADMIYGPGDDPWSGEYGWNTCNPIQDEGGRCGYTVMEALRKTLPAGDGRMKYTNYGKGVMLWEDDAEAARFVNGYTQLVSNDLYWYTDPNICDEMPLWLGLPSRTCRLAANYGVTMDKMRRLDALDGRRQPIWSFVEDGHPFTEDDAPTITGDQLAGAVMSSLIHEARGIIYFNHNFGGPCQSQHVLRDCGRTTTRPAVTEIDRRIRALAPVLNSQSYQHAFHPRLDTMLKERDGSFYVFAMLGRAESPGTYTFTLPSGMGGAAAEVLFEDRTVPITAGAFSDRFAAEYSYHVYRITPPAR